MADDSPDAPDEDWGEIGAGLDVAPESMDDRVRAILADNEDMHIELQSLSREVLGLREKLNTKDAELLDLRNKIVARDRLIGERDDRRTALERRVTALEGEAAERSSAEAEALDRIAQLEVDIERRVAELESEIAAHQQTRDLLATTADECDGLRARNAEQSRDLVVARREARQIAEQLWQMRAQHGASVQLLDQIRALAAEADLHPGPEPEATPASPGTSTEATVDELYAELEQELVLEVDGAASPPDPGATVRDRVAVLGLDGTDDDEAPPDPGATVRDRVAVLGVDTADDDGPPDPGATVRDKVAILGAESDDEPDHALEILREQTRPPADRLAPLLERRPTVGAALTSSEMNPTMAFMLSQIDGRASLRDVLGRSPLPRHEAAAILVDLIVRGVVRVEV